MVGVDGSPASRAAIEWAARRAQLQKLPLLLVHAVPEYSVSPESIEYQSLRASLVGMLDSEAKSVRGFAPDVEVRSSLHYGEPSQVLAELSARSSMVAVGTDRTADGHSGGFGTLNFQLAMIGRCPVAVIPTRQSPANAGVVVGIDGSPESIAAAYFAAAEAARTRQELTVICVSHSPARWAHPSTDGSERTQQIGRQGRMILEAVVAAVRARHIHLTVFDRFEQHDVPARVLIEAGKGAAMLVVGNRGRGAAHHALMGSTTQALLLEVPCPLILTQQEEAGSAAQQYKDHGAGKRMFAPAQSSPGGF
ncbi:universal stress protein [Arthrobacter sp. TWP1-1]|uniref:universal stress protein n=1 Tax=Arthrobacter sp. TWP1-1 TaxID=2804568 RepID=UPI003CE703FF